MKKSVKILIAIVALLIVVRIALNPIVKHYVNQTLEHGIKGYAGHVEDVEIHLYRGAYALDKLVLKKVEGKVPVPFITAEKIDFSIAWRALFRGQIVADFAIFTPVVNFVQGPDSKSSQAGVEGESSEHKGGKGVKEKAEKKGWRQTFNKVFPLDIERVEVNQGQIHFKNFHANPPVDVYLRDLDGLATNLHNTESKQDRLVSELKLTAKIQKSGTLKLTSKMNILKKPLEFDGNVAIKKISLVELNAFLKTYAGIDADKGEVEVYSEMASIDGELKGYVKPFLRDVRIISENEDYKGNVGKLAKETVATVVNFILRYYPKDEMATKIPVAGSLKDPKVGVWPAIKNAFKHAFVEPYKPQVDKSINIKSVNQDTGDDEEE
jgi:hypothetical protein